MNRTSYLRLGIALCACSVLTGCGASKTVRLSEAVEAKTKTVEAPRRPIAVEVFEVKPQAATSEQLIPAVISVESTAVVLAKRDGIIAWLGGQEGARVTKDEVIARLDDDESRSQFRQTELEVSRMKVEELQYEAMIKVNRSALERQLALLKDGLSSKADVDHAQYQSDVSQQELEKTRLATQMAQAKVEAAKLELEKTNVRAPLTGLITHRYAKLGTSVVRNDKLFEVSQLAPLEVRFQIPQSDKRRIAPGKLVELSLVENDRAIAQARIRRIDPIVDAASNALGYLADVIGGASLLPGTAVYVRLPPAASDANLRIPRAAFPAEAELRSGAAAILFVLDGEHCVQRTVWIVGIEGEQVSISAGLNLGDRVILAPPVGLKAGDLVEAM